MSDFYKRGIDLFEKEYEKVVDKGNLTASDLELSCKILEAIKNSYKICKLKEESEEYGEDYSGRRGYSMGRSRYYPNIGGYYMDGSYAPYSFGQSGARPYMRGYSGDGNYGRGNSNNSSALKAKLNQLMNETTNDHERMMVQSWIDEMSNL